MSGFIGETHFTSPLKPSVECDFLHFDCDTVLRRDLSSQQATDYVGLSVLPFFSSHFLYISYLNLSRMDFLLSVS